MVGWLLRVIPQGSGPRRRQQGQWVGGWEARARAVAVGVWVGAWVGRTRARAVGRGRQLPGR